MSSNPFNTYLNLEWKAPHRLARLKQNVAKYQRAKAWRDVRFSTFRDKGGLDKGFNTLYGRKETVFTTFSGPAFGREQWADEVEGANIRHTGWFADGDQGSTVRGFVASLPHGRYLAGFYQSDNDERVYYPTLIFDPVEAAHTADGYAEAFAAVEREFQERWQEARRLQERMEEELLPRLREVLVLRHNRCFTYARQEARALLAKIRDIRHELATDYADCL